MTRFAKATARLANDEADMTNIEKASTTQRFNDLTAAKPHRPFSFSRIVAITLHTLTELTRLKVVYVLLVFALLLNGIAILMAPLPFPEDFQLLKHSSLG